MDVSSLLHFVVVIVILGLIFWLVWWFIGYVGLPEPFNKVARVIVALVALVVAIDILLNLMGGPGIGSAFRLR